MNRAELMPNAGMFFIWDKDSMYVDEKYLFRIKYCIYIKSGRNTRNFDMIPFSLNQYAPVEKLNML